MGQEGPEAGELGKADIFFAETSSLQKAAMYFNRKYIFRDKSFDVKDLDCL